MNVSVENKKRDRERENFPQCNDLMALVRYVAL